MNKLILRATKKQNLTLPCPACKKILFRYAKIKGEGIFQILCVQCDEMVEVKASMALILVSKVIKK